MCCLAAPPRAHYALPVKYFVRWTLPGRTGLRCFRDGAREYRLPAITCLPSWLARTRISSPAARPQENPGGFVYKGRASMSDQVVIQWDSASLPAEVRP